MRNVAQDFVHKTLEILSGVFQAERCAREKEETERCDDASLFDVFVGDRYLMVPLEKIDFAEYFLSREVGVEVGEVADGIFVVGSLSIETTIISAYSPSAAGSFGGTFAWTHARLFGYHERGGPFRFASFADAELT